MSQALLEESFAHRYDAEIKGRVETPDGLLYFPARPGLKVEVRPKTATTWTGAFGGHYGEDYLTGLFTTPADTSLCVVCSGMGYFIQTDDPDSWISIDCVPIRFALPFPQHGLLVFGNFTEFVSYGFDRDSIDIRLKVVWCSARLGHDDLTVIRVTQDRIEGKAWDAPGERMIGFSVDARTGDTEGGASEKLESADSE